MAIMDPATLLYQISQLLQNSSASSDKTIGSSLMTVDNTVKTLTGIPAGTTRITFTVIGTDIIYGNDLTNPPTVTPVRGFRLTDGQTADIRSGDFTNFQITRFTGTNSSIYIEYKQAVVTALS